MIEKLVSGGQTGADIAALDVALNYNFPHGGWCPKGRLSLDVPCRRNIFFLRLSTTIKTYLQVN